MTTLREATKRHLCKRTNIHVLANRYSKTKDLLLSITLKYKTNRMSHKNYYLRVMDVMEVFQHYHNKGYTNAWIYRNHIRDRFRISIKTLYNYMNVNYKRELLRFGYNVKENERFNPNSDLEELKKQKRGF